MGKWILKQMQGVFQTDSGPSDNDEVIKKGTYSSINAYQQTDGLLFVIQAH